MAPPVEFRGASPDAVRFALSGYGVASADYDDDDFEEDELEEDIDVAVDEDDEDDEVENDGDSERDELGPLGGDEAPVEVAVESDDEAQSYSPTPPSSQPPEALPKRRVRRRDKRFRHREKSDNDGGELAAQVARDMNVNDETDSEAVREKGRRRGKRKGKPKVVEAPASGSSSVPESLSLPPSTFFDEDEKGREQLEKEEEMNKEAERESSQETRNDADEEVDNYFSDGKEWSIDSRDLDKDAPDTESAEVVRTEEGGEEIFEKSNSASSQALSEIKEVISSPLLENSNRRQLLRTKARLERSKVMEEMAEGQEAVEKRADTESRLSVVKTEDEEENRVSVSKTEDEIEENVESSLSVGKTGKEEKELSVSHDNKTSLSPQGLLSTSFPDSATSQPTENGTHHLRKKGGRERKRTFSFAWCCMRIYLLCGALRRRGQEGLSCSLTPLSSASIHEASKFLYRSLALSLFHVFSPLVSLFISNCFTC